ncbi:MAG: HAMP domain-containing histidine kinase [Deltaproteobacteria bacterium]|nr:HAMP domain-containing histidine kinase [Deltaproteobacteria bacterium]
MRFGLFIKVLLWFLLGLLAVAALLPVALRFRPDLGPGGSFFGGGRFLQAARLISDSLGRVPFERWDAVLERHSEVHKVDFVLLGPGGRRIAGRDVEVPRAVFEKIAPPVGPPPVFTLRTTDPVYHWAGVPLPPMPAAPGPPFPPVLLARSTSMTGHGLYWDPVPWAIGAAAVLLFSAIFWLPLVRSITGPIARVTRMTEEIARGRFDVRLGESRSDEIGRLCAAVNDMALRLDGYVKGQKRFLGDVSHELRSPISRIQVGLEVLREGTDEAGRVRVDDILEDVRQMSGLVDELLSVARAEADPGQVRISPVDLAAVVEKVAAREGAGAAGIKVNVKDGLVVSADPLLLSRALSNLLRNAIRYAADAGPIEVTGRREDAKAIIEVRDGGPGVPAGEIDRIFDPFYRPEGSRSRETGGSGLGLAIVKTCIEACGGTVAAKNLSPKGFAVTATLDVAEQTG